MNLSLELGRAHPARRINGSFRHAGRAVVSERRKASRTRRSRETSNEGFDKNESLGREGGGVWGGEGNLSPDKV